MDAQHRASFQDLRAAIGHHPTRLVLIAFDLLHVDGKDLRRRPLAECRARLEVLLDDFQRQNPQLHGGPIQFSQELIGDPQTLFTAIDAMGLEGMVSNRADSLYVSGPSKAWQKAKCFAEGEFELIGVQREKGKPAVAVLAQSGR